MKNETNRVINGIFEIALGCFINSRLNAPIIRGISIKNENLTALSFSIPKNKLAEIVMPLLEMPGSKASTCINPIAKALFLFTSLFEVFAYLVEKTIIPVKIKNTPIKI